MRLTLADIERWDPAAIRAVSGAATARAESAAAASARLAALAAFTGWGGVAGDAARDAVSRIRADLDAQSAEARALLTGLGALDQGGRITAHGRILAKLPLHPRLGHMLAIAGPKAAALAALMADRDPLKGAPPDLTLRLRALADPKKFVSETPYQIARPALERIRGADGSACLS